MIILDCDNVISDDQKRVRLIDVSRPNLEDRFRAYFDMASQDDVPEKSRTLLNLIKILAPGEPIAISTMMPESYRKQRMQWLIDQDVPFTYLFMRKDGDPRPAPKIKQEFLFDFCRLYGVATSAIRLAVDDHPEIIQMYKAAMVPTLHFAIHTNTTWEAKLK